MITEYKVKEALYQKEMGEYKNKIDEIQKKNKNIIENRLGKLAKNADQEKAKVIKCVDNIKELTTKI